MKLKGNYFNSNYMTLDVKEGLIQNPSKTRIIALTEDFLIGFRKALIEETGQAHHAVFETCGKTWGDNMASRLEQEIESHYECKFNELPMSMFALLFKEFWARHSWGELTINWEEGYAKGIFEIHVENPPFASIFKPLDTEEDLNEMKKNGLFHDDVFTGLIAAFFSKFARRTLECYQTSSQENGQGVLCSTFVVGIPERLKDVRQQVLSQKSHHDILSHAQKVEV